jgi:hypothetical protein
MYFNCFINKLSIRRGFFDSCEIVSYVILREHRDRRISKYERLRGAQYDIKKLSDIAP